MLLAPGRAGFFAEDQAAIRAGAVHDGFDHVGRPRTPGTGRIREPGTAVSVLLVVDDGRVTVPEAAGPDGRFPPENAVFRGSEEPVRRTPTS